MSLDRPPHGEDDSRSPIELVLNLAQALWSTTLSALPQWWKPNTTRHINQLPVEILSEIFLIFLKPQELNWVDEHMPELEIPKRQVRVSEFSADCPLLLRLVCRHWSDVADATPLLWSSIYIQNPERSSVDLTELWLEKASNHLLNLSIVEGLKSDPTVASDIMALFVARCEQWKSVKFYISESTATKMVHLIGKPPLPQIESVELSVRNPRSSDLLNPRAGATVSLDDIWKFIHSCSTLRRIDWKNFYHSKHKPQDFPSQITHVSLSVEISAREVLRILRLFPKIESASIQALSSGENDLGNIFLPSLKALHMSLFAPPAPLFKCLTLPALQKLGILYQSLPRPIAQDTNEFDQFLSRSNCTLTELDLADLSDEADLQPYLKSSQLSHVKSHFLHSESLTDALVQHLTLDDFHQVMPSMESLDLTCHRDKTSDGTISRMIHSRWSQKSLRRIGLGAEHTNLNLGPTDRQNITRMVREGLLVDSITYRQLFDSPLVQGYWSMVAPLEWLRLIEKGKAITSHLAL